MEKDLQVVLVSQEYDAHDEYKTEIASKIPSGTRRKKRYPMHVLFIIGNEFGERFAFYGMRSVLLLYLRNFLRFDDDGSTQVYHAFIFFAYLFPLVGAVIADSYWGKYKTILRFSVVYVLGLALITFGSIPYIPYYATRLLLSFLGLFFIALGTGGIKPCVSSFGGDQFAIDQAYQRKQFFSFFYFAINAGSLISTFLTPVFRADLDCYPNQKGPEFDECYALAFGVPALVLLIAMVLFVAGTAWYIILPHTQSVFLRFCFCIKSAVENRVKTPKQNRNKNNWLEYADAPEKLIRDTKYVFRVLILFVPLPFFWALFDQQGSRWTLQAIQTNGYVGEVLIKPDQVETLNPLLIVTLIPLFEVTLFPFLRWLKVPFPPLRRMTVGLLLACASFVVAALVQIQIEKNETPLPSSKEFGLRLVNAAQCDFTYSINGGSLQNQNREMASTIHFVPFDETAEVEFSGPCLQKSLTRINAIEPQQVYDIFIVGNTTEANVLEFKTDKDEDGGSRFTVINFDSQKRSIVVTANPIDRGEAPRRPTIVAYGKRSAPINVAYGNVEIRLFENDTFAANPQSLVIVSMFMEVGAVYSIVYVNDEIFTTYDISPNTVNVLWLFPQFLLITVGEVFLSITGLEFSYSQAPPSMKSVLTSFWLLTVSMGNLIVIIVAETKVAEKLSTELFVFAILIFLAAVLFMYLAYKYIPVDESEFAEELQLGLKQPANQSLEGQLKLDDIQSYENDKLLVKNNPGSERSYENNQEKEEYLYQNKYQEDP